MYNGWKIFDPHFAPGNCYYRQIGICTWKFAEIRGSEKEGYRVCETAICLCDYDSEEIDECIKANGYDPANITEHWKTRATEIAAVLLFRATPATDMDFLWAGISTHAEADFSLSEILQDD